MTNNATKTYRVGVIERVIAYYRVEAEDARSAAESWAEGEFYDRDDEALDTEGPCSVRERQPDGSWRKLPRSEWGAAPPAGASLPEGRNLDAGGSAFGEWYVTQPDAAMQWLAELPKDDARHAPFMQNAVRAIAYQPQGADKLALFPSSERPMARAVIDSLRNLPDDRRAKLLQALNSQ